MDRYGGGGPAAYPTLGYPMPPEDGCLQRVPYASIIAFVLCFVGIVFFVVMMIFSFNASVEQARRALDLNDLPWLDKVHLLFLVVAVVMVAMALYLLCVGILSTGATRQDLYKRSSARRGGKISCLVAIVLAYALNIAWMGVFAITAVLATIYYLFSTLCASLTVYSETSCLDLGVFRPLVADFSKSELVFCGGAAQQFCALTNTVITWYVIGCAGSLLVCLGLVQFVATNAANYSHISSERRYSELRDVLFAETYPDLAAATLYAPANSLVAAKHALATPPPPPSHPPPPQMPHLASYNYDRPPLHPTATFLRPSSHATGTQNRRNSYHASLHESGWMPTQY